LSPPRGTTGSCVARATPFATIDLIIGTYCIEHNHTLLHADRDFDPMETLLGLKVVPTTHHMVREPYLRYG
jgi:predicted nucleic acid-binding protein